VDELNAFERQVAEELSLMSGGVPFVDAPALARHVTAQAPPGGRSRTRSLGLVAVFLAVVIAAGIVVMVLFGGGGLISLGDGGTGPQPFASFSSVLDPAATAAPDDPVPPPPPARDP
jgi:hypothetical protein